MTTSIYGRYVLKLTSIIERLRWEDLFVEKRPVEVELGSGDGSFIVQYAAQHPEINFLAVERLLGRLHKVDRKSTRLRLQNIRCVRIEAAYLLEYLLPKNQVANLHLYFPDPWPKRRHWKNRLVNERFPVLCAQALVPGGTIFMRTDNLDYFVQMKDVFKASPLFEEQETPPELKAVTTDFERFFNAQGIPTNYAAYRFKHQ